MGFSERLKESRKKARLTQVEIAFFRDSFKRSENHEKKLD